MLQLNELSTPTTLCCDDGYDLLLSCPDDKYPPGPPSFIRFSNTTLFFSHFFLVDRLFCVRVLYGVILLFAIRKGRPQ